VAEAKDDEPPPQQQRRKTDLNAAAFFANQAALQSRRVLLFNALVPHMQISFATNKYSLG
jgi:hypothetical protein